MQIASSPNVGICLCYDMYRIMKALRDVNFEGIVILDHTPEITGGHSAEQSYGFAYMKALFNRANAEARA